MGKRARYYHTHAAYGESQVHRPPGFSKCKVDSQQPGGFLSGRQMQVQCAGGRVLESRTTPRLNAMSN